VPSPLSLDLRRRIIAAWKREKLTILQLAERFDVGAATVKRLQRRFRQSKSIVPSPHGGGTPRKIPPDKEHLLDSMVLAHPDWSEDEYAEELWRKHRIKASGVTVGRAIRRLGYSVKKRHSSRVKEIARTSSKDDGATSNESDPSPLRVWFLWTKRARTSR
jgi:transposase